MRKTDSSPEEKHPICSAIDRFLAENGISSQAACEASGISAPALSKWRSGTNVPDRDAVLAFEKAIAPDRPVGFLSVMAGYVDTSYVPDELAVIRKSSRLTPAYSAVVLKMVASALEASAEERAITQIRPRSVRSGRRQ